MQFAQLFLIFLLFHIFSWRRELLRNFEKKKPKESTCFIRVWIPLPLFFPLRMLLYQVIVVTNVNATLSAVRQRRRQRSSRQHRALPRQLPKHWRHHWRHHWQHQRRRRRLIRSLKRVLTMRRRVMSSIRAASRITMLTKRRRGFTGWLVVWLVVLFCWCLRSWCLLLHDVENAIECYRQLQTHVKLEFDFENWLGFYFVSCCFFIYIYIYIAQTTSQFGCVSNDPSMQSTRITGFEE